jgi:excinuclease ABC subunit B
MGKAELQRAIDTTRKDMQKAAKDMDFLQAAKLRDEMFALEKMFNEKFGK